MLAFDPGDFFDTPSESEQEDDEEVSATAVNDARPTTHWLGRDFFLQDEVWIDMAYQPGMPKELYEGRAYQPAELAHFARLGQVMLVVVEERAYEIPANAQGSRPVLLQKRPQPLQRLHGNLLLDTVRPSGQGDRPEHLQLGRPARTRTTSRHAAGWRAQSALGWPRRLRPRSGQRGVHLSARCGRVGRASAHVAAALRDTMKRQRARGP